MDMTIVMGPHQLSLQATIDHHESSVKSSHYTTSVNFFYCNDGNITDFEIIDTKISSASYVAVAIYELITWWVLY